MRVLLAAKYVPTGTRPIGGVQSWIRTVREELKRLGHRVVEWQPGMPLTGAFDLGIIAHMKLTQVASWRCERIVNVSHGIIPDEKPGTADRVVFVSEGVRDHWGGTGDIVRQPIDLSFWRDTGAVRRGAVRYTYRRSPTLCEAAAAALRMPYEHVSNVSPAQARVKLATAEIVFASGRAALEAMACGARVVIYDHRSSYQGPLAADSLGQQMRNSYSGRGGFAPKLGDLVTMAKEAHPARAWVEEHHDARQIVKELLA